MPTTQLTSPFLSLPTEIHIAISSYLPFSGADALRLTCHHFYSLIPPLSHFQPTKTLRGTPDGGFDYDEEAPPSLPASALAVGMTETQWQAWIDSEDLEGMIEYDAEESWLAINNSLKVCAECRCLFRESRLRILIRRMKFDDRAFGMRRALERCCGGCTDEEDWVDVGKVWWRERGRRVRREYEEFMEGGMFE